MDAREISRMTFGELAGALHRRIDADDGWATEMIDSATERFMRGGARGLRGLDTPELERLAGAAFWFLFEGRQPDAAAAVDFFRNLGHAASLLRHERLDHCVRYGKLSDRRPGPVSPEEHAAAEGALAETAALPSGKERE